MLARPFARFQFILLVLIPVLSIHNTYRLVWQQSDPPAFTYVGGRGVALVLADGILALLAGVTLARLAGDTAFLVRWRDGIRQTWARAWWALLVWMALSVLWADEPVLALHSVVHNILALNMAILAASAVTDRRRAAILYAAAGLGAAAQAGLALLQVWYGGPLGGPWLGERPWLLGAIPGMSEPHFRGYGLATHPNTLAGYLVVGVFAWLALFYARPPVRWIAPTFGVVTGLGLLATMSRTALAAAGITLFFALAALSPRRSIIVALLAAALLAAVGWPLAGDMGERIASLRDSDAVVNRLFYAFPDTTAVIRRAPLRGAGAGNLMIAISRQHSQQHPGINRLLLPAHNVFWMIWGELGLPGLLLFGWGCVAAGRRLRRETFIWTMCFVAICLIMCFDFYWWGDFRMRTLLFWVLGIVWGTRQPDLVIHGEDVYRDETPQTSAPGDAAGSTRYR